MDQIRTGCLITPHRMCIVLPSVLYSIVNGLQSSFHLKVIAVQYADSLEDRLVNTSASSCKLWQFSVICKKPYKSCLYSHTSCSPISLDIAFSTTSNIFVAPEGM